MLSRLFGRKPSPAPQMVIVRLNAKLQPIHRGEFFEDPLDVTLRAAGVGEVTGGGTMQGASGEIEYCDIELMMPDTTDEAIAKLVSALESLGAPKGSKVQLANSQTEREIAIGRAEGLAVFLNGTELPDSTYQSCDSNVVHSELGRLLEGKGRVPVSLDVSTLRKVSSHAGRVRELGSIRRIGSTVGLVERSLRICRDVGRPLEEDFRAVRGGAEAP